MYRRFRKMRGKGKEEEQELEQEKEPQPSPEQEKVEFANRQYVEQLQTLKIFSTLSDNKSVLEQMFEDCSDFVIREYEIQDSRHALAVFVDGLVDTAQVNVALKALMIDEGKAKLIHEISLDALPVSQITEVENYTDLLQAVLSGDTGVIVDGNKKALLLGIRGAQMRSIAEPETESVVRGPREGFIENIRTNTAMIRRKLKTPHLKMKPMIIGKHSNTNVVISYLDGVVDPKLVEEVTYRLSQIKIDVVLESGYLEELIQDSTFSPFPQIQYSERPDTVAASLAEGRVAILIDGTPFVLIVPATFWMLMQANEDYYERFQMATMVRWLRYIFVLVALTTPALYIAITTFHQSMLPTPLLLSLAAARETIPFPAVVEAFIMETAFEALREAGVRLPKTVGQAVSILGALVVGQAAVEAGIVSAPMVIIVSITGIASFTVPRYNAAIALRMLRFPLMIAAALFGMYGIMIGLMLILGHMAKLRSFGVPYLSPTGPLSAGDLKDVVVRAPWGAMTGRPAFLKIKDERRVGREMQEEIERESGQKGILDYEGEEDR